MRMAELDMDERERRQAEEWAEYLLWFEQNLKGKEDESKSANQTSNREVPGEVLGYAGVLDLDRLQK